MKTIKLIVKCIDRSMFISLVLFLTFSIIMNVMIFTDFVDDAYRSDDIVFAMAMTLAGMLTMLSLYMIYANIVEFIKNYRWNKNPETPQITLHHNGAVGQRFNLTGYHRFEDIKD